MLKENCLCWKTIEQESFLKLKSISTTKTVLFGEGHEQILKKQRNQDTLRLAREETKLKCFYFIGRFYR